MVADVLVEITNKKLDQTFTYNIPNIFLRASYEQRLDLLRGFMDTDGYYNPGRKRFVMC